MSQSKPLPPTSSSAPAQRVPASSYWALSLLCLFLLWKGSVAQIASRHTPSSPLLNAPLGVGLHLGYEMLLIAAFAYCLQQSFRTMRLSTKKSLRGGFLGAWLASLLVAGPLMVGSLPLSVFTALSGLLAAFAGSLVATAKYTSLWEENLPASRELQQRVWEQHCRFLGAESATPPWKRAFDIGLCLASLPVTLPLALSLAMAIWLEDPGAIFFVKNSVGKWGRNFRQLKFRTMIQGAEENSGPTLARENDPRVLRFGRLLRKTALDELPQLWNILRGEMSFVGPRPQRTALVDLYLQTLPQYAERHRLPPGLSGLAQVAGSYYLTPLQKLRFDRLYIRHAALGYDLRLLAAALALTFYYRWLPNWKGRLPRRWLHAARSVEGAAKRPKAQG